MLVTNGANRHRNRLGDLHGPHRYLSQRRTRLCKYYRTNRRACVSVVTPESDPRAHREARYPAGHVYIFRFLYEVTRGGSNIALAQQIFAALYVISLTLTCSIYRQAGAPNWIVCLLPLSKRLHSIFVLRLFNDCWSVVAVQGAILAYQTGWDDLGTLLFR